MSVAPPHIICYNISNLATSPMYPQRQHIRITLDLEVMDDFEPRQINWDKLFDLHSGETCEAYVEELDTAEAVW